MNRPNGSVPLLPSVALDVLTELGVDCVYLANNHALDFGCDALLDTFRVYSLRTFGTAPKANAYH